MKKITNINVIASGSYVPEKIVTNEDLEQIVETSDEWIYSRTGIKMRHYATLEDTSDLAYSAAKRAIESINYDTSKIDLIIVATFTPDFLSPGVSNLVQAKLGLSNQDITCFDLNAACTGFIYALNVASKMLGSGEYKSALVIGSEVISKVIDFEDRNTCVLFGDGAGCLILENTDEEKPAFFYTSSTGELEKHLYVDSFVHMNGKKVYQFAISACLDAISKITQNNDIAFEDISAIIPHQANIRIIQNVAKTLNLDMDRFFLNIHKYGNTSAASIAIALDEYIRNKKNKQSEKILLVGFGAGFTYGASILTI